MNEWRTIIQIDPVGKARPRSAIVRGKGKAQIVNYTPDKTAHVENLIRDRAAKSGVFFDRHVPIRIHVDLVFRRPPSVPKRRLLPTVRPDFDNCTKLVCDALNGVLFYDDAQICDARTLKFYGESSFIRVIVQEIAAAGTGISVNLPEEAT